MQTVSNLGEHFKGAGHAHDNILEFKPDALIVYEMGSRGLSVFQKAKVAVLRANASTVKEVIAAYKEGKL